MPSQKSPKPKPVEKMTTEEAIRYLFPERVVEDAKRRAEELPRKKGDPPRSMSGD